MDAIIATNTTLGREGVAGLAHADEAGGLSGAPVRDKSTHTVKVLAQTLGGRLPIIAVGGITEGRHAAEKIEAGASLVQLYSGFIYKDWPDPRGGGCHRGAAFAGEVGGGKALFGAPGLARRPGRACRIKSGGSVNQPTA